MANYKLNAKVPGYYTSLDAKNKRNSNSTVKPGTYKIFNKANGMINLALKGRAGWWINPSQNKKNNPPKESNSSSNKGNNKGSKKGEKNLDDTSYNGANSSTTYTKNPHYMAYDRDKSATFYITNLISGTTMEMDMKPNGFSEGNSSNYNAEEIRGRSTPIYGYSSSGPRSASFELHVYDDYCYYGLSSTVKFLKALAFPSYNGGVVTPPKAYIRYGSMISMRCIVETVEVAWSGPTRNGIHVEATISLSVKEITQDPYSVGDIEKGSDYTS